MQSRKLKKYQRLSLVKLIFRDVFILILLGIIVSLFYWIYQYSDWLPIKNFNVSTRNGRLQHITVEEINSILKPYRKQVNFLRINLNQLKHEFENKEWISQVTIIRSWPDTINIIISERVPIARWFADENLLVDNNGELFKGVGDNQLVLFQGQPHTEKIIFDLYQQLHPLLERKQLKVEKIQYTERSALIIYLEDGKKIFLGRENMLKRLERLLQVWDVLLTSDVRPIDEIHMEYREGFSVKYEGSLER